MDKTELRREIRQKKRNMTQQQIDSASEYLCRKFLQTEQYRDAKTIYAYLPYNQEVKTQMIVLQAWADGKKVAVPKIYGEQMRFLYITDFSQVEPGYCNIPEPIYDEPIAEDKTALVLMPGLAFDSKGRRLGYGGGYYDKFLRDEPEHPKIALCYHFQMVEALETEEFDVPVDLVISAEEE